MYATCLNDVATFEQVFARYDRAEALPETEAMHSRRHLVTRELLLSRRSSRRRARSRRSCSGKATLTRLRRYRTWRRSTPPRATRQRRRRCSCSCRRCSCRRAAGATGRERVLDGAGRGKRLVWEQGHSATYTPTRGAGSLCELRESERVSLCDGHRLSDFRSRPRSVCVCVCARAHISRGTGSQRRKFVFEGNSRRSPHTRPPRPLLCVALGLGRFWGGRVWIWVWVSFVGLGLGMVPSFNETQKN